MSAVATATDPGLLRTQSNRGGIMLVINTLASGGLGLVYWIAAARLMPPMAVGSAAAAIAVITAASNIGQLNLGEALPVLIPRAGQHRVRLLLRLYLLTAVTTAIAAAIAAVVSPSTVTDLASGWIGGVVLIACAIGWTIFFLQDSALTGMNRNGLIPIENTAFGIAKLGLLIGAAALIPAAANNPATLIGSWYLPLIVITPVINWFVIRHLRNTPAPSDEPMPKLGSFIAGNYLGALCMQAGMVLLPFYVALTLGTVDAAVFTAAWTIVAGVDLLAPAIAAPMSTAISTHPEHAREAVRSAIKRIALLVTVAIVAGVIAAPFVLHLYGPLYADQATGILQILLIGSAPRAIFSMTTFYTRAHTLVARYVALQAANAVLVIIFCLGGAKIAGLTGFALGWVIANTLCAVGCLIGAGLRWWHR